MSSDWVYFIRTNSVSICEEDPEEEEKVIVDIHEELQGEHDNGDDEFQLSIDEVIKKSEGR